MNRLLSQSGILAFGTGTFAYLYHSKKSFGRVLAHEFREDAQQLEKEHCLPTEFPDGKAKVPRNACKEGPLVLQLQQVIIMFRHGARTPIYTIPKIEEKEYEANFVTRCHQGINFPYTRLSSVDNSPKDWSSYEKALHKKPLRGGALRGKLTSFGKEQMYDLGHRLRDCYSTRLDIWTYDPTDVRVMSSNVVRTVESAKAVMAGLFGKKQLTDYAGVCGPVPIYISDPCYDILIPNTNGCEVLKKVNMSAMIHPDCVPGFKEMRLEVEEHIMKPRQKLLDEIAEIQSKIESMTQFYEKDGIRLRHVELNKHREEYMHDPIMQPLYDERSHVISKIDRFWANILNRDKVTRSIITVDDMRALIYLRDMRVEEFKGTFTEGYRIHLYFDKNPYFYNDYICKVVYTKSVPGVHSKETPIYWKPCMSFVPEAECVKEEKKNRGPCKPKCTPKCQGPTVKKSLPMIMPKSFFHWLTTPTIYCRDPVTNALTGDIWKDPMAVLEAEPLVREPWDHNFNFVYARDDVVARVTSGWYYPEEMRKYRTMIEDNAASIMHYAMTGQNDCIRHIVTKLSAGPLLTDMMEQAKKAMSGQKDYHRLCLYSSHDSTMTALLEALGIWDNKWPPFGSDVRLEIYREVDTKNYFIRVLYNGKERKVRCQEHSYMPFPEFCKAMSQYIVHQQEYKRICKSDILEKTAKASTKVPKVEKDSETEKPKSEVEEPNSEVEEPNSEVEEPNSEMEESKSEAETPAGM